MSIFYQDDDVTLHHGDALRVLAEMPDSSVDAVITDPPYSSGGQFRSDRVANTSDKYGGERMPDFSGDNRDQRSFLIWMNLWLGEATRVLKPGGVVACFTDWRQLPTMTDALQVGGLIWRGLVPWVKPGSRPAFRQRAFLNQCEFVVWGTVGQSSQDETKPLPGFYASAAPREREHQTQKPLDVMRGLVQIAPEGGVVLDPFMGSGTTGVAAVLEGRRFVGIELSPHYVNVAMVRVCGSVDGYRAKGDQMVLGVDL